DQLMIVHVGDQGFAHRIGDFKKNIAVALGLDQLPDGQALIERQSFENVGNVGRVQLVKLALQLSEVLPTHQIVNAILVLTFLAMGKVFDQAVAVQQVDNLRQAVLQ